MGFNEGPSLNLPDESERVLLEKKAAVKKSRYFLQQAIDKQNLREALRCSAQILGELRTGELPPDKYYDLYLSVFQELLQVKAFFASPECSKERTYRELYELVQHAGNVLPRLYLMCTVGAVYISAGEGPCPGMLQDLVEMCKGVQHPTRGLFLRHYLCQVARDLLPDTSPDEEAPNTGTTLDSIDFLLHNFTEMNKLWVRLQYAGQIRDRARREKERQQLADLVGRNLTYISQLTHLNLALYQERVLPRIMEQIMSCKDVIAQEYLLECVTQCYPDDFHLATLQVLLGPLPEVQPGVEVGRVVSALMSRLAQYAASSPERLVQVREAAAFNRFMDTCAKVAESQAGLGVGVVLSMYTSLLEFTGEVEPANLGAVNQVMEACYQSLKGGGVLESSDDESQLQALLATPLKRYAVVEVLQLDKYPTLMSLLRPPTQRRLARSIVTSLLDGGVVVAQPGLVKMLFSFVQPLLDGASAGDVDADDVREEQELLGKLTHCLQSPIPADQIDILKLCHTTYTRTPPTCWLYSLLPVAFAALRLVRQLKNSSPAAPVGQPPAAEEPPAGNDNAPDEKPADEGPREVTAAQVLQFVQELVGSLQQGGHALPAFRLLLLAAHSASEDAKEQQYAYDFMEMAFDIYDEAIDNHRQQKICLYAIFGTLQLCSIFPPTDREALSEQAVRYTQRLYKKIDKCQALCASSHIYWQTGRKGAVGPAVPMATATTTTATTTAAAVGAFGDADDDEEAAGVGGGVVQDAQGVMKSLTKAIRTARMQVTTQGGAQKAGYIGVFVSILNHHLYYFEQGNRNVTTDSLSNLMELIQGKIREESGTVEEEDIQFYRNTLRFVQLRMQQADMQDKYAGIKLAHV